MTDDNSMKFVYQGKRLIIATTSKWGLRVRRLATVVMIVRVGPILVAWYTHRKGKKQ